MILVYSCVEMEDEFALDKGNLGAVVKHGMAVAKVENKLPALTLF